MNLLFPTKNIELELGETITFNQVTGKLDASRIEGDLPAEQSSYDNTESGLEATNVQDAVDEVNNKIENIPSVDAYTKQESDDKYATNTNLQTLSGVVDTNDAELVDIRTGADGTTYASAGDAVRGQISDLQDELKDEYIDKVVTSEIIANEAVKLATGEIISFSGYSRTDYIDIADEVYVRTSENCTNCCYYDANKTFISSISGGSGSNIDNAILNNAKYIIISSSTPVINRVVIKLVKIPTIKKIYDELDKKIEKASVFGTDVVSENVLLQNVIGVSKFPNNLVLLDECVDNKFVNTNAGNLENDTNYFCTGFIPVVAEETYKANHGRNLAWYNASKTYISGVSGTSIQRGVTAPQNAAYIRFTINKTTDGIISPFDLYFTKTGDFDLSVTIPDLTINSINPWCYGKKINWIGDSIVDGQNFDEEVCNALGLVKNNEYGINGSTIALNADGTDGRNALCMRYSAMSDDADIIAVSCGTNDFEYAWCPIGDIDSTENTTFYGALKTLCEGLINKYPQKLIFFTTPIKRAQPFASGNGGTYTEDGVMTTPFSKNKYGKTLGDYADIIKEVCGYYSIPVLDMNRESLLNPHLASQQSMFDNAYTHPNTTGQKIMARRVAGWLSQLGYIINGLN